MRSPLLLAMIAGLSGCSDGDAAPTPRERMSREFLRAMKAIDLQYGNIHEDLKAGKSPEEIKGRLAVMRQAAERASALPYREVEAENRDLAFEFRRFLDATRAHESATWKGEEGVRSWRSLGAACASCHDLYREER